MVTMGISSKTQKVNLREYTPEQQLGLLCEVLRQPALPPAELNRLLQLRYAWHRVRGLPPQAARALERLMTYLPPEPAPEKGGRK